MSGIEYPETNEWEEWMHEYKFGAFFIFPPEEVIESIDALRKQHDPRSASYCQAHVSLSEPLTGPLTNQQIEELKQALYKLEPFEMTYGPLRGSPPYPGVTYTINPEDKFMELREAIHSTSAFKESPLSRKDRAPHMTIAEFGLDWPASEKLIKDLDGKVPEGSFIVKEIELAVPDKNFYFQRVLKIPLGTV